MATVNDKLLSDAISRQIDLIHYENGIVNGLQITLQKHEKELLRMMKLVAGEYGLISSSDATQLINDLIRRDNFSIKNMQNLLESNLKGLSRTLSDIEEAGLKDALPASLRNLIEINGIDSDAILSAVLGDKIEGATLDTWMRGLAVARAEKIRAAIRLGVMNDQSVTSIFNSIQGQLLTRSRSDLSTLIRTTVAHTSMIARNALASANPHIVASVRWVSVLDNRTTLYCIMHDGHIYPVNSGPRPPAHFNCRSSIAYVLKSWIAMGLTDISATDKASLNGESPESVSYADWMSQQSDERVTDILGTTRAKLYLNGTLKLSDFVNRAGYMISLQDLATKYGPLVGISVLGSQQNVANTSN